MTVGSFLRDTSFKSSDKTALIFGNSKYTYEYLNRTTDNIAFNLRDLGVLPGNRVMVATGNCPETILSLFAVSKMGAIFVPLNPATKIEKFDAVLKKCDPSCLIYDQTSQLNHDGINKIINEVLKVGTGNLTGNENAIDNSILFNDLCKNVTHTFEMNTPEDKDTAMIIFTSGSTGDPKGVTLSHSNIDAASSSIIRYLKNTEMDIILNAIPLSFDYGLYQSIMSVKFGGTLVLERSFSYFNLLLEKIQKERVTGFPIVPSMAEILIRFGNIKDYDLSSLRYITNTAQALYPSTIEKLIGLFPGVDIYSMYGLTECKRVSFLDPKRIQDKPTSVGKAIPGTEIFLIDDKGERIREPGRVGELAVKGPHIMQGYWREPKSTAEIMFIDKQTDEKILLTGDFFRFDEDGDFYFMGRKDTVIKIGGEKASPVEVESVIASMKGIISCAVVPIPDDILGNKFICIASKTFHITEEDVLRYCSERLEKYLVPKRVVFLEKMPLTPNGKIDREMIKKNIGSLLKE